METTAALGGTVFGGVLKTPVGGARVVLRHGATGDVFETRTNHAGRYLFTGLRPGERLSLRVGASGHEVADIPEIVLSLGEDRQLDVALSASADEIVHLEKFVVEARREHPQPGTSTALTQRDIEERPSIDQTVNDYATADPRVTMLDEENSVIAAAGQHHLFNSLQIDGIRLDDGFGLSDNGLPALGNPFSMETIQAVSVDLAPYDVRRSGFTGASINAVTRSGENAFSGSAYYKYANEKFRAKDPATGQRTRFTDETYGFTLAGPIIRNRLFFFVNWQRKERTDPSREASFIPAPGALERIVNIAREKYGIEPGVLFDPGERSQKSDSHMAKLDWRINARHRLSARYSSSYGDNPVYQNYASTASTSLSSHWYVNSRDLKAWSAQMTSQWHPNFQTEISFANQRYSSDRQPNSRLPQIRVNSVDAADGSGAETLWLGAYSTSHLNFLTTKKQQAKISATWLLGRHTLQFGAERVRNDFDNKYLDYAWGHYAFASINDFESGKISSYIYQYTADGGAPGFAWGYAINTAFLQVNWRFFRSLTITTGLRFDYPEMNEAPRENKQVEQTFGVRNNSTIDGVYTFSPRVSFTWSPRKLRKAQVRGGVGIFQGQIPGVWMGNSYINDGMTAFRTTQKPGSVIVDVDAQPEGEPGSKRMRVDMMDKDLRMPSLLRGNIAVDFQLPWQRMSASIEWLFSRAEKSLVYRNLNLKEPVAGPDGRPLYGEWEIKTDKDGNVTGIPHITDSQLNHGAFDDVYWLTNADKDKDSSRSSHLTFSLSRPMRNHWSARLAYTRGHATEVSPFTNSSASANFTRRIGINPNSDESGASATEIRDRVIASVTTKFALVRGFDTVMTLTYDGHSGRPYSFTFRNDANGDGQSGNDLFYVPAGRNDPKLYWASKPDEDAFFAYLATNDALRRYAGKIVSRNSERSKFQHRLNLSVTQQIPFWRTLRAEVYCTITNLANLLNEKWGRVYQYNSPYNLGIAYGYYDPEAEVYRYSMTDSSGNLVHPRAQPLQGSNSRWRIQTGVRVRF
ncbi:hypothetical protein M2447_000857 [Ereboglobus sp. PH5-10]|uniref:TonB-dependent receptor n=1 Tax=Ereboglobus sp. PH5-10 TaxID=2940629 RepID=UPI0024058F73|nr:TonB-dependent receptor [Ereboglobus sp. PH5-10]MDF9826775.1 hypothetical protein [Ereboglobus sp. PH5-10]